MKKVFIHDKTIMQFHIESKNSILTIFTLLILPIDMTIIYQFLPFLIQLVKFRISSNFWLNSYQNTVFNNHAILMRTLDYCHRTIEQNTVLMLRVKRAGIPFQGKYTRFRRIKQILFFFNVQLFRPHITHSPLDQNVEPISQLFKFLLYDDHIIGDMLHQVLKVETEVIFHIGQFGFSVGHFDIFLCLLVGKFLQVLNILNFSIIQQS